jgi:hypothetical protein
MNAQEANNIKFSENIIIVDGDYIDYVAFQLSVQFERIIGRKIPHADMSQWIIDIALDGGLRENEKQNETQVVFVHDAHKTQLDNFTPAVYDTELNAQAFKDEKFGEFLINAFAVENITSKDDYILDLIKTVCSHEEVKRVMIVPNGEQGDLYDKIRDALHNVEDDTKRITVFAMQPLQGGNFRQEILGYSLMNALGIKANEIK